MDSRADMEPELFALAARESSPYPSRVPVQVKIDGLDDDGRGVGTADGVAIHVAGALPGETVAAEIEHRSPHAPRAWARLVSIQGRPADERVEPPCPAHPRCGGCVWQHVAYPAQLTEKRRTVEQALGRSIDDVIAAPHEIHYRNKAKYVIAARAGKLVLGSYAPASHDVLDMAGCRVPQKPLDEVARAALAGAEREGLSAYDEQSVDPRAPLRFAPPTGKTGSGPPGELRHLVVRANHDGEVLVVWVTRTRACGPALTRAARALRARLPAVAGIVQHVNPHPGNAIFHGEDHLLDGVDRLADRVGEVTLELSAQAFFQVNRDQAARLYAEVARLARGPKIIDLYTGVGGIALTLARRGHRVEGVEVIPSAIDDARRSAAALGLPRARFRVADAGPGLRAAAADLGGVDTLVVNPPRKGLAPDVRDAILALAPPRVVYVSCGPRSLAADLAVLGRAYAVTAVRAYDLMPGTPHVETVVCLDLMNPGSARPAPAAPPAPAPRPPRSSRRRG
jgi:23S rRNA (uracil1939-C5)-methyltransferase